MIAPLVAPGVESNAAERKRGGMVRAEPPTAASPVAADLLAVMFKVMLLASFRVSVMLVTWIDPNFWPAVTYGVKIVPDFVPIEDSEAEACSVASSGAAGVPPPAGTT